MGIPFVAFSSSAPGVSSVLLALDGLLVPRKALPAIVGLTISASIDPGSTGTLSERRGSIGVSAGSPGSSFVRSSLDASRTESSL